MDENEWMMYAPVLGRNRQVDLRCGNFLKLFCCQLSPTLILYCTLFCNTLKENNFSLSLSLFLFFPSLCSLCYVEDCNFCFGSEH